MISSTALGVILLASAFIGFVITAILGGDDRAPILTSVGFSLALIGLGIWNLLSPSVFHLVWLCLYAAIWLGIECIAFWRSNRPPFGNFIYSASEIITYGLPCATVTLVGLIGFSLFKAWF